MFQVPLKFVALSVLIYSLWGGNAIAGKFALEVFPPFWSACLRFVIGIATVWAWCRYRGICIWPQSEEWKPILGIGLLFTVQIALMNLGFDNTTGMNASILISSSPLFAAVFAHLLIKGDRLSALRMAGLVFCFCAVCLTLWRTDNSRAAVQIGNLGDWLCLGSAALLGLRLIISARAMRDIDSFRLAIGQMIVSVPLFAGAGLSVERIRWERLSIDAVLGLLYQGVVVAGVGFMVSLWLMSRYRASTMASFNFVTPISGVLLAVWLLDETLGSLALLGMCLLAAGMILLNWRARQPAAQNE